MAELSKNTYNEQSLDLFTKGLKLVTDSLDAHGFVSQVMNDKWEGREPKRRWIHITNILKESLPIDYKKATAKIPGLLDHVRSTRPDLSMIGDTKLGLVLECRVILDNYVEQYGLGDHETSAKTTEKTTQLTSYEFMTHPFITKYLDEMMKQTSAWLRHEHWGVRRLVSEGYHPHLPWAMALLNLKKDLTPIIPILGSLKNNPARFVRLNAANSLSDITEDNPEIVIDLAKKWKEESEEVDWTIKHGCRTFLKRGIPEVMELFGFDPIRNNISVEDSQILSPGARVGDSLESGFNLLNHGNKTIKIRLEYGTYYQKINGTLTKKVHKISEKEYIGNSATRITWKCSFCMVTTREFHLGLHQIAIIINGNEFGKYNFDLIE